MERILRSQEMVEIILLPVRHHSPACAFHVRRMAESCKPSVILVEGPENANALLPVMTHEETKAPFAIYYSYHDKAGTISEEKERYRCYYPFLEYSPELAALRAGKALGIPAEFIDLSYGEILLSQAEGKGLRREEERQNYNDDYLLTENQYLKTLCEKAGLRNFDEFWEKYFEIAGLDMEDETWFRNLLTYCAQARENTPAEALREEGCLARERRMAEKILEHARKLAGGRERGAGSDPGEEREVGSDPRGEREAGGCPGAGQNLPRILVVTGGFHTMGLKELLEEDAGEKETGDGQNPPRIFVIPGGESIRLNKIVQEKAAQEKTSPIKIPLSEQGVYLMPYSMEAADALNGYASGMPFPGFYQKIWEGVTQGEEHPFGRAVLDLLISSGKEIRKKEGYPSTYDEICGWQMAEGLAALRGKREPGAYELLDAVLSSYVKGEYNIATDTPMRVLRRQMTGGSMGRLWEGADVPPIIHDFRAQCKKFGLKTGAALESEVTLSIFSSRKHREMSMFFYQMGFLHTEFARKKKGPNLSARTDRNLMREIWGYKWNVQVDAALLDVSVHGATLEEAAGSLVKEKLKKDLTAGEGAKLLVQVFEMGLADQLESIYGRVRELIRKDTDFFSLTDALDSLVMMQDLGRLYQTELRFDELLLENVRKAISMLPVIASMKEDALTGCMNALKLLYQITGRPETGEGEDGGLLRERDSFFETLLAMQRDPGIQAGINGCIQGILYGGGRTGMDEVELVCKGYLSGTEKQAMKTAQFFRGLFFTARDLVFADRRFLKMLDVFLGQVEGADFMELLPELRMAFTYFTPREIDRIAETAAGFHGRGREAVTERREVLPAWSDYGRELDAYARANMSAGGKRDG